MIAVGNTIEVSESDAIDLASGAVFGTFTVSSLWRVGSDFMCNLSKHGRVVVSSIWLDRLETKSTLDELKPAIDETKSTLDEFSPAINETAAVPPELELPPAVSPELELRDPVPPEPTLPAAPPEEPTAPDQQAALDERASDLDQQFTTVLLFDFMNLLCRSYFAAMGKGSATVTLLRTVAGCIERLHPDVVVFAGEGGRGFRHELYPKYKSERSEKPDDLVAQIELGKKAIAAIGWPFVTSSGFEADDVLASAAKQIKPIAETVVVVSTDKDMRQLVADGINVYDPYKRIFFREKHILADFGVQAHQLGDYLALNGDKSDSVPGVKGIGPKAAAKVIASHKTLDNIFEFAKSPYKKPNAAMWNKLRDGEADARISRQLVELTSCPLPANWERYQISPVWVDRLRALDLSSVVVRLLEAMA